MLSENHNALRKDLAQGLTPPAHKGLKIWPHSRAECFALVYHTVLCQVDTNCLCYLQFVVNSLE